MSAKTSSASKEIKKPASKKSSRPSPKQLKERIDTLESKLASIQNELELSQLSEQDAKDQQLRALAELENFKRRKEQEKADFIKFSNERFVTDLIPILDSFDMAINQVDDKPNDQESLKEGFLLIHKQFKALINKMGVEAIPALNQTFDPEIHQAVSREKKLNVDENTIIKEMQVGYQLNNRVIRPSMVVVSHQ